MARPLQTRARVRQNARNAVPIRAASIAIAIAVVNAACGDPSPRVRVAGGPLLIVAEGELLRAAVTVDPATETPELAVEIDPLFRPLFEVAEVAAAENGLPELRLQPTCNAVSEGSGDVPIPIHVVEARGRAVDASLTVVVRAASVDEPGACAPTVDAWLGTDPECLDEPPSPRSNRLAVPPQAETHTFCLRVRRAAADHLPLWLTVESAPPSKLIPGRLAAAEFEEARLIVPLTDSRYFRGEFQLAYHVFHAPPAPGVDPFFTGAITLVVGDVGEFALSTTRALVGATELGVVEIPFRVWRYDDIGSTTDDAVCVRASRAPERGLVPLPREKPFARVYNTQGKRSDGWLCSGDTFFARVSPPIDSKPLERAMLVACRCASPAECDAICPDAIGDCDGEADADALATCLDVALDVASVADELLVPPVSPVACADVGGDSTIEVLVGDQLLVGVDGRTLAAIPVERPDAALALRLAGTDPVILGRFAAPPHVRSLVDGAWVAATDLGFGPSDDVALDPAAAVGETPGAPTGLVVVPPAGPGDLVRSIELRCLAPGCAPAALPVAAAPVDASIVGLAAVDLDGGGDDVVLFVDDGGARIAIPISIDWSAGSLAEGSAVPVGAAGGPRVGAAPLGGELLFVDGGQLRRLSDPSAAIATPGPALAVASTNGRVVVSTPFGIEEVVGLSPPVFAERDPVVREDAFDGAAETPPPGYGASLVTCADARPVALFSSSSTTARITGLDVVVADP